MGAIWILFIPFLGYYASSEKKIKSVEQNALDD